MPSSLATVLFTWSAIYAYAGTFYCMLHWRRPTSREYLAFGLTCFGLTVWSAGSAVGVDADTLQRSVFAVRLAYVGGFASVAFFADLVASMTALRDRRMVIVAYVVAGLAIAAAATGLLVHDDREAPGIWSAAMAGSGPTFTPLGAVLVLVTLALACWSVLVVLRATRRQRELRAFAAAGVLAAATGGYEVVARILGAEVPSLVGHTGLLLVLAISWLLLRRFVRAADELQERTQELRKSYGELRITQEELVRKEQLAAVGELSAVIAHEVRNPLAIIKNAVSSMRRPTLRATDRGVLLGILDEEVDRLNRLVRDLLAYARPVEPRGRPIELAAILGEIVESALASHEAPETIDVELDLDRCPTIHGDPDLLRQAITNVVDNALAAMTAGGTLTLRAEPTSLAGKPAVVIECIDTGDGMDALVLGKARDPFFTTRAAGTGLGLAIVERVVKNHRGTLSIESEQGAGTTVRIVLPKERPASVPPPEEIA